MTGVESLALSCAPAGAASLADPSRSTEWMLKYQPSPSSGAGTCRPPSISSLVLVTLQVWAAGSAGPAGIASRRPATTASVTPPGRVNVSSSSEPLSVTAALLGAATGRCATDGPATAWPPSTVTEV